MTLNPRQARLYRIVESRKAWIVRAVAILIWEQLERSISDLRDVDYIFAVYAWGSIEGRANTLIKCLTFGYCKKEMRNQLLKTKQRIDIRGARHLPRILGPVNERFSALAADLFHAALRSCSNLFLVRGFAALRRLTDGDADGWATLGNSLGQSTQKKPWLLKKVLFEKGALVIGHIIDDLPRGHKMIGVNRFYMLGNLGMPQCNGICVTTRGRWKGRVTSKEDE